MFGLLSVSVAKINAPNASVKATIGITASTASRDIDGSRLLDAGDVPRLGEAEPFRTLFSTLGTIASGRSRTDWVCGCLRWILVLERSVSIMFSDLATLMIFFGLFGVDAPDDPSDDRDGVLPASMSARCICWRL